MDVIKRLKIQDYLSLLGISISWLSILLILVNQPNYAILAFLIAFLCDSYDGYIARKQETKTSYGGLMDSLGDLLIYVVFSSLFFHQFLSPNPFASFFVGVSFLVFGILRLIRYTEEGVERVGDKVRIQGINVVFMTGFVVLMYYISLFISFPSQKIIYTVILLILCPTMISNIMTPKPGVKFATTVIVVLFLFTAGLIIWK